MTSDSGFQSHDEVARLLRTLVAGSWILLIGATLPLWTGRTTFPQVPFMARLGALPGWVETAALIAAIVALSAMYFARRNSRRSTIAGTITLAAIAWLVLVDQHRFQPWVWQLGLFTLALITLPSATALRWLRMLVITLYAYSALSKLDVNFFDSIGSLMARQLFELLQIPVGQFDQDRLRYAAILFPVGELLVALALALRRTRRVGVTGACLMHLTLIAIVGPWGLGHEPGVLLWNVALAVQVVVLFRKTASAQWETVISARSALVGTTSVKSVLAAAMLLPVLHWFDLYDTWPSWAVYAGRTERAAVFVNESAVEALPTELREYVEPARPLDDWRRVRIDRWSLDTTIAPIYPQNRFRMGGALAIASMLDDPSAIRVDVQSSAAPWSRARETTTLTGRDEILDYSERYWINVRPR